MERFNTLYIDLLNFLIDVCPKFKKYISINPNPDKHYLIDFMELNLPYMEDISVKNADIFKYKHKDAELIRGIKFRKILSRISSKNAEILWKRLHSLYILAYNSCDLKKIAENNYPENLDIQSILENNDIIIENITMNYHKGYEEKRERREKGKKEKKHESSEGETDEEGGDFGNFDIENIGKMLGDFFTDGSSKSKNNHGKEREERRERKEKEGEKREGEKGEGEKGEEREEREEGEEGEQGEGRGADIFQGTLIGDLAKELSSEIDPADFGEIKDPSDLFKMVMGTGLGATGGGGSENRNKFGNVMEKVIKKLDEKVKGGEINQGKLFEEAQKVMGNLMNGRGQDSGLPREFGNIGNMMRQFGMMQGLGMMGGKKNKRKHRKHKRR